MDDNLRTVASYIPKSVALCWVLFGRDTKRQNIYEKSIFFART